MATATETLPKCIQDELTKLDEKRAKVLTMTEAVQAADRILEEHRISKEDRVGVGVDYGQLQGVFLFLYVKHWREVVPVLRALADAGFRQSKEPEDYFELHARTWTCGDIILRAFLPWDNSGACRRVKVGEKTEPVYEWQCDNGNSVEGSSPSGVSDEVP